MSISASVTSKNARKTFLPQEARERTWVVRFGVIGQRRLCSCLTYHDISGAGYATYLHSYRTLLSVRDGLGA
jgi:hypothetical protein